ncbi:TetR/AcrR family transcriptional regulator [Staphylococcus simulans]
MVRKDALENRKRIETCARQLFSEKGVENVSMNQISKTLGIGMATLYRNFEDKQALCYQLIENDFEVLFEDMHTVLKASETGNAEKFERLLDVFLAFKKAHKALLRCVEENKKRISFKQHPAYAELFKHFYEVLGTTEDSTWNTFKTDMLLNSLTTNMYQFQQDERGLTDTQLKHYLLTLFK